MKLKILFLIFCTCACYGQGARFGDERPTQTVKTVAGQSATFIVVLPNSTISICNYPANASPCTNKATTYTDNTLTTPCANNTQIVLANTTTCVSKSDAQGNWGVWVAAGNYSYTFTSTTGANYGPYPAVPGSSSSGSSLAPGALAGQGTIVLNSTTVQGVATGFPGAARSPVNGTTDSILCDTVAVPNDRLHSVEYTSTSAVAVTLPNPATTGCGSNFAFKLFARSGTVTVTPAGGATISYYGMGSNVTGAASMPITAGAGCFISSPDNTNWVAGCSGTGQGKLLATPAGGDFCTNLNNFMARANALNIPSPVVDTADAEGPLTCSAVQPFANWQTGWAGGEIRFTVPIKTDWPWIIPTKFSLTGNIPGDCSNGPNASICATAAFRANFPASRGCTTSCPNSSTVFFATNTNTVSAGTNSAGSLSAGGTANFGGTCTTVTAAKMCGMNFHICPAASTGCDRSNAINLGRVTAVTATGAGASVLTLEVNTHSPITLPANGTGYQWYAEMPVVQMSTLGNGCTGSGNSCISNTQWLANFAIDAGDGTSDIHSGYENTTGQEGVGFLNLTVRNARGGCFGMWTTAIQDSGPYINARCGGASNIVFPITIPWVIWQPGYLRQIIGMSLVTANVEPVDMLYCNTINQGGVEVTGGNHMESAALALQLGCPTVWPWAANGTGARGRFSGLSGNGSTGNLVEIMNIPTTNDLALEFNAGGGATNCVIDDRISLTIPCGQQQRYKIGADFFSDGITTQNCASSASPALCGTATSGSVALAAGGTTLVVQAGNITANTVIQITEDSSLGTKLGVTCNVTTGRTYSVSARTAGTSFTIASSAIPLTNPACLDYSFPSVN